MITCNDLLNIQYNLRKLLYVRPYDLPAIEASALKLCDAVVDYSEQNSVVETARQYIFSEIKVLEQKGLLTINEKALLLSVAAYLKTLVGEGGEVEKDLIIENAALKEEVRKLRAWLNYEDWVNQHYFYDRDSSKYWKMKDGKPVAFSLEYSGVELRKSYAKLNNL